ncbi:alkaline phytoceramidase [Aspergillus ochraceoroseus]|uniref:Alkaline phytoceramidase n=1 Tax=Aspergillus ochraceoroseus TaxID=138278 RepID=A0A0F8X5I9_9EURO|nr:alkaline phytoceramidase [Aspergillus ochraceoroseus]
MRLIPFIPYPPAKDGFWEPVTSTLNWCEEDYYATKYAAEIINTLTNLLFMLLGVQGILSCRRHGHDSIFQIAYYGYLLVDPMQLVDELSMIYTTCLMCYASFSYSKPTAYRIFLGAFLAGLAIFITLYYHYLQDPLFHQNAYALLTTVVVLRSMYTMEVTLRPSLRHTTEEDRLARQKQGLPVLSKEQQQYENARDLKNLNLMWFMVAYGLGMFLGGFGIWNLDNHFCTKIRGWRREVGLPWGIFLEGHGWWHLMTGIGAYLYIVWGIWLRHCLNKRQEEYHLWWPHIWNIPEVIRTSSTMNGSAKKSN